jgi:restriction system protein
MLYYVLIAVIIIDVYAIISSRKIKITHKQYKELGNEEITLINNYINRCSDRDFELFCGKVFEMIGYNVEVTNATRDSGKDLILDKDTYVELKHWSENNNISRPLIQKLIGSCVSDGIKNAIFLTTSYYTKEAIDYSDQIKKTDISLKLMYRDDLIDMVKNIDSTELLKFIGYSDDIVYDYYVDGLKISENK